jgi:hypothetical protein
MASDEKGSATGAILTLGQAARAAGVAKSTITRAIREGRLSGTKNSNGSYSVDRAELVRVFERRVAQQIATTAELDDGQPLPSPVVEGLEAELRQRLAERDSVIEDLRRRLDAAEAERRAAHERIVALLTDQREQASQARRWWRPWRRS